MTCTHTSSKPCVILPNRECAYTDDDGFILVSQSFGCTWRGDSQIVINEERNAKGERRVSAAWVPRGPYVEL